MYDRVRSSVAGSRIGSSQPHRSFETSSLSLKSVWANSASSPPKNLPKPPASAHSWTSTRRLAKKVSVACFPRSKPRRARCSHCGARPLSAVSVRADVGLPLGIAQLNTA